MSNLPPLQSQNANFDDRGFAAVKTDLQQLAQAIDSSGTTTLTGANRVLVPRSGVVNIFFSTDTATVSTSTAYHVITALRNGQSETGISINSFTNELVAYKEYYAGQRPVSQGNIIAISIAVTGSPSPTLSIDNITIRCELSEE
jgi:hypothetical protein